MKPGYERREQEDEDSPYVTHDDLTINNIFAATLPIAPDADAHLLSEIRASLMDYMVAEAHAHRSLMEQCSMRLAEIDSRLGMAQPEPGGSEPSDYPAPTPVLTPAPTQTPEIDLE
jgi:hypothetical protein